MAAASQFQRRYLFELVEPIGYFGGIQRPPGKHRTDTGGIDDLRVDPAERIAHASIE